jgi:hypothetical protein
MSHRNKKADSLNTPPSQLPMTFATAEASLKGFLTQFFVYMDHDASVSKSSRSSSSSMSRSSSSSSRSSRSSSRSISKPC